MKGLMFLVLTIFCQKKEINFNLLSQSVRDYRYSNTPVILYVKF